MCSSKQIFGLYWEQLGVYMELTGSKGMYIHL